MSMLPICSDIMADPPEHGYVMAPWVKILPAGNRDLLSLLPVADVNGATLRMLDMPARYSPRRAFAALMLADPFLRLRDTAALLRRAGIAGVTNFPTMQLVDGETARVFESANARAGREIEMLRAFAEEGLETIGFICGGETVRDMIQAKPGRIVIHPGVALSDWRQRAAAALAVSRAIEIVRSEAACPVLVYRPEGFGAELDQAVAAADGEARMVD
jgi:predicted TIM-barrel enzyme